MNYDRRRRDLRTVALALGLWAAVAVPGADPASAQLCIPPLCQPQPAPTPTPAPTPPPSATPAPPTTTPPPPAQGLPARSEASPGLRYHGLLDEPGIISAKPVDGRLYVSSLRGISIWDIRDPRRPVRLGGLVLPHSQNEDVDVGSGVMLVSDDPVGGRGILYVVDIRDPAKPRVLSRYDTWRASVPRNPFDRRLKATRGGKGHTATCIDRCRWVWLAGYTGGIDVVDLRDPRRPRYAKTLQMRNAAGPFVHDVQVDETGRAWVAGAWGTAGFDVRSPTRPRLITKTGRSGERGPWNDLIHHSSVRPDAKTLVISEEDFGRGRCRRAGSLQTWRISGRAMTPLDRWSPELDGRSRIACSAHYADHRDGLVAAGFYEQGLRVIDVRRPSSLRQVDYYVGAPAMVWGALFAPTDPTGSVIYVLDHSKGIEIVEIDRNSLTTVRRKASSTRSAGNRLDVGIAMDDGLETARRGARVSMLTGIFSTGRVRGSSTVRMRLPAGLTYVSGPRGATYSRASRTVRFSTRATFDGTLRRVTVRVSRSARPGRTYEVIATVTTKGDLMAISDRAVERVRVGRRTRRTSRRASASAASAGLGRSQAAPSFVCIPPRL